MRFPIIALAPLACLLLGCASKNTNSNIWPATDQIDRERLRGRLPQVEAILNKGSKLIGECDCALSQGKVDEFERLIEDNEAIRREIVDLGFYSIELEIADRLIRHNKDTKALVILKSVPEDKFAVVPQIRSWAEMNQQNRATALEIASNDIIDYWEELGVSKNELEAFAQQFGISALVTLHRAVHSFYRGGYEFALAELSELKAEAAKSELAFFIIKECEIRAKRAFLSTVVASAEFKRLRPKLQAALRQFSSYQTH